MSKSNNFSAIVVGGTGATGRHLVRELVQSPQCSKIGVVVRKQVNDVENLWNTGKENEKINQIVVDFDKLDESKDRFTGYDQGYCLLGTTRSQAGSAEAFRKVDYQYTMTSAKLMKEAGINHFHLVTSMGSNANSWFLYPQTKGQVENECMQLGFNKLTIYRPGLLFTPRDEKRTFEAIVQAITPVKLGMPVETLGKLFVQHTVANLETPKFEKPEILENGQIWQLFEKYSKN